MKRILLIAGMCGLIVGCSQPMNNDQIIAETNKCIQNKMRPVYIPASGWSWENKRTIAVECQASVFRPTIREILEQ